VLSELGARHILGVVYAIDKQIVVNEDRTVTLEEEIDQRLKESIEELLTAIKK